MGKFYGEIGYASDQIETTPGVWVNAITTRQYYGDIIRNMSKNKNGDKLNDDVTLTNQISIVADPFANQNFYAMKYVKWLGVKWEISSVDVKPPRLILTLGEVYNE